MNPLLHYDPNNPYPESDGQPMADNTEQFDWLVKIKENLEILFAERPDVFIAGDLLWYPVPDRRITNPVALDVMVVFGRPFLTSIELAQRAEQEHQRAERLAERLRALGIDPNDV